MITMNSISALRKKYDVAKIVPCTPEENARYAQYTKEKKPLPTGIYKFQDNPDNPRYGIRQDVRPHERDLVELPDSLIMEYLKYKELDLLTSIKNYLEFFVILTVIGIVLAVFSPCFISLFFK